MIYGSVFVFASPRAQKAAARGEERARDKRSVRNSIKIELVFVFVNPEATVAYGERRTTREVNNFANFELVCGFVNPKL